MDFVECDESFLQSNSPDILTLSETNLDDSIYSSNLSVKGYLTLIQKDTVTDSGLAVYVMEGLPFVQNLSLEKSVYSFLCFWLALLQLVSYYFFLYWSPFVAISSHTDDVPSISLSTNVFVFGDLTFVMRTGCSILVEQIGLVNSVIVFVSQMTLLRWLTFLLGSLWLSPSCSFGFLSFSWC